MIKTLSKTVKAARFVPGVLWVIVFLNISVISIFGQASNSISGGVFGPNRQPLGEIQVELLDEFSRMIKRTRTNSGGQYLFSRIPAGRYKIRVVPLETIYEAKEEEVEIVNFSRQRSGGGNSTFGTTNEQRDLYLRPRKDAKVFTNATVFAQEVPVAAKNLYEKAIADLEAKKQDAGLAGLRSALEEFPEYFNALERLGTEYVRLGHFDPAEVLLLIAVYINPRSHTSWYGLAFSQYSLKKYKAALESAEKAIETDPRSSEPYILSGTLMRNEKRFGEAEKRLIKARELSNGNNAQVHWELALLYSKNLKRYKEAANELRLFLKIQPDSRDAEMIKKLIADFEIKTDGQ